MARADRDPRWVDAILDWRWTWLCARIALTGAYVLGAANKIADFPSAIAEQAHFGLHPPALWAVLTILVEMIGPALIISGRFVWLGTGMLGVFTGLAAIVATPFWSMTGQARFAATNAFFEHIGLIAGFVLAALIAEHDQRQQAARNLDTQRGAAS
ncbi:MAG: DoxX family protein [Caulobacteraceae bacterium]|nr:DoxX family protein [Caulobacteraceae bacterium]